MYLYLYSDRDPSYVHICRVVIVSSDNIAAISTYACMYYDSTSTISTTRMYNMY